MTATKQPLAPQSYPPVPPEVRLVVVGGGARLQQGPLVAHLVLHVEELPGGPVREAVERLAPLLERRQRALERVNDLVARRRGVWEADLSRSDDAVVAGKPAPEQELLALDRDLQTEARQTLSLSRAVSAAATALLGLVPDHGRETARPILAKAVKHREAAAKLQARADEEAAAADDLERLAGLVAHGHGGSPATDPAVTLQTQRLPTADVP